MTETTWVTAVIAAIAAVPPTIVAWATLRQSKLNAGKADVLVQKADEIHTLTNSNLTRVTAELALANDRIAKLEELIGRMSQSPHA